MFVCDEENQILQFLQSCPQAFFSGAEISRKAGSRKLFTEDPRWAFPFLSSLTDKKLIEKNESGHFRFKSDGRS